MSESEPYPSLLTRPESAVEAALANWFAEQQVKSVDNLEAAARQIITLCTSLLGLLLGLMALADTPLPAHMSWSGIRWLSGLGVAALVGALGCALVVVLPRPLTVPLNDPAGLQAAHAGLLARKHRWLTRALVAFGGGILAFALLVALAMVVLFRTP